MNYDIKIKKYKEELSALWQKGAATTITARQNLKIKYQDEFKRSFSFSKKDQIDHLMRFNAEAARFENALRTILEGGNPYKTLKSTYELNDHTKKVLRQKDIEDLESDIEFLYKVFPENKLANASLSPYDLAKYTKNSPMIIRNQSKEGFNLQHLMKVRADELLKKDKIEHKRLVQDVKEFSPYGKTSEGGCCNGIVRTVQMCHLKWYSQNSTDVSSKG